MSRPLELTVYPKLERPRRGEDIMAYRSQFIDEQLIVQAKRLTDAELASEFHKSTADFQSSHSFYLLFEDEESEQRLDRARDWMFRMELFATLPNHDEEQS